MTVTHPTGQPYRRRLLSGRTVPAAATGRTWNELVVPAPAPSGCASLRPEHPSSDQHFPKSLQAYVVTAPADVPAPQPGQARRRDRRQVVLAERRAARRGPQPTGGALCPCTPGVTYFYNDDDREFWDEMHSRCDEVSA